MKGLTDGGSLVAEKFFKVDVPDGQHLGTSRDLTTTTAGCCSMTTTIS